MFGPSFLTGMTMESSNGSNRCYGSPRSARAAFSTVGRPDQAACTPSPPTGLRSGADPADPPDALPDIVGHQQAAVLGGGEPDRPAPDLRRVGTGKPESGQEILVAAQRLAVLEADPDDLVAGRQARIPGPVERDEGIAAILCGELGPFVEFESERCGMGLEQQIGGDRRGDQIRPLVAERSRLLVPADEAIGPAVEAAVGDAGQIIRYQPVAEPVPLVDHGEERVRPRIDPDPDGIAQARGED